MFKKGDFARCIDNFGASCNLCKGRIYLVNQYLEDEDMVCVNPHILTQGWFANRFVKIKKEDLTPEEKFSYIKYKLGVRSE